MTARKGKATPVAPSPDPALAEAIRDALGRSFEAGQDGDRISVNIPGLPPEMVPQVQAAAVQVWNLGRRNRDAETPAALRPPARPSPKRGLGFGPPE